MKTIVLSLIRFYQLAISPLLGTNCRFFPSCSCYAHQAYREHGTVKATFLTVKRLLRCQPFGGSGYDPVPNPQNK